MDFQLALAGIGLGSLFLIALGFGLYRLGKRKGAAAVQTELDQMKESYELQKSKYKELSKQCAAMTTEVNAKTEAVGELEVKLEEADLQIEELRNTNIELIKTNRLLVVDRDEALTRLKMEGPVLVAKKRTKKGA